MNRTAAFAIAFAGVIHLILAPMHLSHAPAHGLFFIVAGAAELVWAYLFLRQPSEKMYYAGIMIAGGLIVLWAITRVLPAPFEHSVEAIDISGIICKVSELVGLVALVAFASRGGIVGFPRRSFARLFGEALIAAFFVGVLTYVAGHDFEPLMPFLGGPPHAEQSQ